jgi:hypothetical protein
VTAPAWCSEIDLAGDVTLIVGKLSKSSRVHGYRFVIHTDVADALREACRTTLSKFDDLEPLAYQSDIALDPTVNYLTVLNESIVVRREQHGRPGPDGVVRPVHFTA